MPSSMSLASSFDRGLAKRHAEIVGDEVRRKGNDVVYAPAMNMLRTPLNGRTFEYFGEDPFLAGQMAANWTRGVQAAGVMANAKHFAVNNQEGVGASAPGTPVGGAVEGSRLTVDAQLDERTLREIYLPQFEAAVKQGRAASIMCSYPRINGQYACENDHLLNDILKGDWKLPRLRPHRLRRQQVDGQRAQQRPRPRHLARRGLPAAAGHRRAAHRPGEPGDDRRAHPPAAAHAVRLRVLRSRRLRGRHRLDRRRPPTTRPPATSRRRAPCCSRTAAACCR